MEPDDPGPGVRLLRLSARAGLPLLYGLCDEWAARRQLIGALGGEPDQLDEALEASDSTPSRTDPDARRAEVAALAAACG